MVELGTVHNTYGTGSSCGTAHSVESYGTDLDMALHDKRQRKYGKSSPAPGCTASEEYVLARYRLH